MSKSYINVCDVHPDYKDGECRECGTLMENRIHKSVQRNREVAKTLCPDCNSVYDPLDFIDVEVRI